jgi:hypothetical protein
LRILEAYDVSPTGPSRSYQDQALAAQVPNPPKGARAVWIIFDELSQAIAFGNRPPGLSLPNLDRLKAVSLFATAAKAR